MPNDEYFEAPKEKYWLPESKLNEPNSPYSKGYAETKLKIEKLRAEGKDQEAGHLGYGLWMMGRRMQSGDEAYRLRKLGIHDVTHSYGNPEKGAFRHCSCGLVVPAKDIPDDGSSWSVDDANWPDGEAGEKARAEFHSWPGHRDLTAIAEQHKGKKGEK